MTTAEAFLASLKKYAITQEGGDIWANLALPWNEHVDELTSILYANHVDHDFGRVLVEALSKSNNPFRDINECGELCQSPIEAMMAFAILISSHQRFTQVWLNPDRSNWQPRMDRIYDLLEINQQAHIREYRVDFLLTLHTRCFGPEGNYLQSCSVVVECDGHEFHDKTKEQASFDRRRDRAIQSHGLSIFRYTGSDIWNDVFAHANEVLDFIYNRIKDKDSNAGN